jgi:tRNA-splicing ligase RtcB
MQVEYEKGKSPVKLWTEGVFVEASARDQIRNTASMPFIFKHVAVMPDVHLGKGSTVGTVIPTKGAIIPAAVGVDIGCGMMAVKLGLTANDMPSNLKSIREAIELAVPSGFHPDTKKDQREDVPNDIAAVWNNRLSAQLDVICRLHGKIDPKNAINQLGTLGSGNHFIELCFDQDLNVWVMLHSGSRGIGNKIGRYFIEQAKEDMRTHFINLPDKDLSYLVEGTQNFNDYWFALNWAQEYAKINRDIMFKYVIGALSKCGFSDEKLKPTALAINCHHNYASLENHFGENVYVTRKGAVRARVNDYGIIPGSMGAKSFIVRGKGNPESFSSCSHGAGRTMSRTRAKAEFTLDQHVAATAGVECRKTLDTLDETPGAYKDIDLVMKAQDDLVEIVHTLKQFLCVKGTS